MALHACPRDVYFAARSGSDAGLRIAIITQRFPTLTERFTLHQVTGLIDLGHEVDVFANRPGPPGPEHREVRQYRLRERTHYGLYVPPWLLQRPHLFRVRHRLKKVIQAMGLGRHPFAAFRRLEEREYDIAHCQFGPEGVSGLLLRDAGLLRAKLVTSFRGFDATRYPRTHGPHVYEALFRRGDLFLAVSEHLRGRVIELGCDPQRVVVSRGPVSAAPFRGPRTRSSGPATIVTIARLAEKKGIEYALRAVARLVSEGRDVRYEIIGDGVLRDDLAELVGGLGLADVVCFRGSLAHDGVLERLGVADVLLAPSVTAADGDQEGVPNALKEAMAVGVPVVATDHAGIPELVSDGVTGLLVPERDSEALAQRVARLLDDPALGERMAIAARRLVEREYDPDTLMGELVGRYQALLAPSSERVAAGSH